MNVEALIGRLTREDTIQLLTGLIQQMPDLDVMEVLDNELSSTIKEELLARWS